MFYHEKVCQRQRKLKAKRKELLKGLVVVNFNHTLGLFRLNLNDHFVSAIVLLKINSTNKRTKQKVFFIDKTKRIRPQSWKYKPKDGFLWAKWKILQIILMSMGFCFSNKSYYFMVSFANVFLLLHLRFVKFGSKRWI